MNRHGSQARRARDPLPGWAWLLAGVGLGVLLGGLVIWRDQADRAPPPAAETPAADSPVADAPRRPRYDFYTILPEQEAVVPSEELARAAELAPAQTAPIPGGAVTLQVGSFRDARDAEAFKARLALLGQVARVVPVEIDGVTWHRVRIGPLADAREAEATRQRLREHGIDSIALRETSP
jgi:cell division protein FtsN